MVKITVLYTEVTIKYVDVDLPGDTTLGELKTTVERLVHEADEDDFYDEDITGTIVDYYPAEDQS